MNPEGRAADRLRITALRTLADLVEQHALPAPMSITFGSGAGISIRLENEDRPGVSAWSEVLGGGPVHDMSVPSSGFVSVRAERWDGRDEPLWLGFGRIDIWSACYEGFQAEGGEQS
jgi:hypothetical protein